MAESRSEGVNPFPAVEPSIWRWVGRHRRVTAPLLAVVVVATLAFLDWPHTATRGQQQADLAAYATQLRGDVQSCSLEVEQTLSAYNQVTAGVVNARSTATAIAVQAALDCTPMGNSRIEDLGALQAPRSLARFRLEQASGALYQWCFPTAVDLTQDLQHLLAHPGGARTLADVQVRLGQLSTLAAQAQTEFRSASNSLDTGSTIGFGLDDVRPGVLVG